MSLAIFSWQSSQKIRVNEFSIGMGPKIFQFGKKETKYTLRLLPIGGYCAMEGEDGESQEEGLLWEPPGMAADLSRCDGRGDEHRFGF